ncbi:MAG: hypothetical protein QM813_21830 [Verrucomicrobiota bacterium]
MTATPSQPAALTGTQIEELNKQLSTMRHDINNHLSLMMAAVELVRRKPEAAERMAGTLSEQPMKITQAMKKFSNEFETTLGLRRS